jgi:hypothetical protein
VKWPPVAHCIHDCTRLCGCRCSLRGRCAALPSCFTVYLAPRCLRYRWFSCGPLWAALVVRPCCAELKMCSRAMFCMLSRECVVAGSCGAPNVHGAHYSSSAATQHRILVLYAADHQRFAISTRSVDNVTRYAPHLASAAKISLL